jgi:hypothetical protein
MRLAIVAAAVVTIGLLIYVLIFRSRSDAGHSDRHAQRSGLTEEGNSARERDSERNAKSAPTLRNSGRGSEGDREPNGPDPNYDPRQVMIERNLPKEVLFENEVRDDEWATERERQLEDVFERVLALLPGESQAKEIECRSGTCRARIVSEAKHIGNFWEHVPMPVFGPSTSLGSLKRGSNLLEPGQTGSELYLFFGPRMRDPEAYLKWHEEWYRRWQAERNAHK